MAEYHSFQGRLGRLFDQVRNVLEEVYGGNVTKLAADTSLSQPTVHRTLDPESSYQRGTRFKNLLTISEDLINAEKVDPSKLSAFAQPEKGEGNSYMNNHAGVGIPKKLVSVQASAGDGYVIEEQEIGTYYVDPSELPAGRRLRNGMYVAEVEGDSMKPELRSGERVIMEPFVFDNNQPRVDGVYHFRIEAAMHIKRLQLLPHGRIRVLSVNEKYPDYEIALDEGIDFEIIGKLYARFERY